MGTHLGGCAGDVVVVFSAAGVVVSPSL